MRASETNDAGEHAGERLRRDTERTRACEHENDADVNAARIMRTWALRRLVLHRVSGADEEAHKALCEELKANRGEARNNESGRAEAITKPACAQSGHDNGGAGAPSTGKACAGTPRDREGGSHARTSMKRRRAGHLPGECAGRISTRRDHIRGALGAQIRDRAHEAQHRQNSYILAVQAGVISREEHARRTQDPDHSVKMRRGDRTVPAFGSHHSAKGTAQTRSGRRESLEGRGYLAARASFGFFVAAEPDDECGKPGSLIGIRRELASRRAGPSRAVFCIRQAPRTHGVKEPRSRRCRPNAPFSPR